MSKRDFKLYSYKGPVMIDDNCVNKSWRGETSAYNKRDAYNRLTMRCRHDITDFFGEDVKVTLPGQLIEVRV